MKDYLGNDIVIGKRAIMCHGKDHYKYFQKVNVLDIDTDRDVCSSNKEYSVQIIADGNERAGWTLPERLIMMDV